MNNKLHILERQGELDFIVCGVARSGTTALTQYLNAFQGVICGPEYFGLEFDNRKIRSPESFFGTKYKKNPHGLNIIDKSLNINQGIDIVFGNKIPHYFYALKRTLSTIRGSKVVVCIRDPRDSARSFNKRADNPKDNWPVGRRGFFAPLDFVCCLAALRRTPSAQIHLVHHNELVQSTSHKLDELLQFLVPGQALQVSEDYMSQTSLNWVNAKKREPGSFGAMEEEAFVRSHANQLYALIAGRKITGSSDLRDLDPILSEVLENIPSIARDLVHKDGRTETVQYFETTWKHHVTLEVIPAFLGQSP